MIRFFCILLILSALALSKSNAQIEKGSWQIGISGAPLFELNSSGWNGTLLNLNVEHSFSNRFIVGLHPYYALTDEKMKYAFDLISGQPKGIQKDVFRSFGINAEIKFALHKIKRFTVYSSVLGGIGSSQYHLYHSNVFGDLVAQDQGQFINYNLGVGFGTYVNLPKGWHLDLKVMYTDAYDNKNLDLSSYVYPCIGVVKSF